MFAHSRIPLSRYLLPLIPFLFLETSHLLASNLSWRGSFFRGLFVLFILLYSYRICDKVLRLNIRGGLLVAGMAASGVFIFYLLSRSELAAWLVLGLIFIFLITLHRLIRRCPNPVIRWSAYLMLAMLSASVILLEQFETNFAEEEFFIFAQALILLVFWLLLSIVDQRLSPITGDSLEVKHAYTLWGLIVAVLFIFLWGTAYQYQKSFYSENAPSYEGISVETPFLCGEGRSSSVTYDGHTTLINFLKHVEKSSKKGVPEYGMLALGHADTQWAQRFRNAIVDEAQASLFAGPAHSLKSIQYEAVLRLYYYVKVQNAFPDLFNDDEQQLIEDWFGDVNRRAMTVEWIDWLYSLAFAERPQGPYLNQEAGTGLIALLEATGLAAPDLRKQNQDFLEQNLRGWETRFRNPDDAIVYQPIWINSAFFQATYTDDLPMDQVRLAFDWMLLQAPPDGHTLQYNYPHSVAWAASIYLGAKLLQEPEYVWLAGRMVDNLNVDSTYVLAQPGVDESLSIEGRSPTRGSCLLYGDSGLPNQQGPLAPDKIVFRDGWNEADAYLLLNLRFTGWHRYKASNTVTLLYQERPLVTEQIHSSVFTWLPAGRQLLRDKRIPREHLNGLLIERDGLHRVVQELTGLGSVWAQDPPQYAEVITFETGEDYDSSHTRLSNWRGWQHDRQIYFFHDGGPIVVVDDAIGPTNRTAAVIWHLASDGHFWGPDRYKFSGKDAEISFMFTTGGRLEMVEGNKEEGHRTLIYYPGEAGELTLVTTYLPNDWIGASVVLDLEKKAIVIAQEGKKLVLPFLAARQSPLR
jgi:hypothetical protein